MRTPEEIKKYIDKEWKHYKNWDIYSAITVKLLCNIAITLDKIAKEMKK